MLFQQSTLINYFWTLWFWNSLSHLFPEGYKWQSNFVGLPQTWFSIPHSNPAAPRLQEDTSYVDLSPNLVHPFFFCLWKNPPVATSKISSTRLKLRWARDLMNVYKRSLAQACLKYISKFRSRLNCPYRYYPEFLLSGTLGKKTPRFPLSKLRMLCCKWLLSWAYIWTESCMLLLQDKEQLANVFCTETTCVRSVPRRLVLPWVVLPVQ